MDSSRQIVWDYFQDVSGVARCLPGAELTEKVSEDTYKGRITIKLGPLVANFDGAVTVESDPVEKSGRIRGNGVDKKGGSRGEILVDYQLLEDGPRTMVELDADLKLSGAAARFGRAVLLEEVARRLLRDFAVNVEAALLISGNDSNFSTSELKSATVMADLRVGSLMSTSAVATAWSATGRSVRQLFRNAFHRFSR